MRSKLGSQAQPTNAVVVTSRTDMLMRCRSMFAASLHQMHAAAQELYSLQQFVRFSATRRDVAWAASGNRAVYQLVILFAVLPNMTGECFAWFHPGVAIFAPIYCLLHTCVVC